MDQAIRVTVERPRSVTHSTRSSGRAAADFTVVSETHSIPRISKTRQFHVDFFFPSSQIFLFFLISTWSFCHIGLDILSKSGSIWPVGSEKRTAVFDKHICPRLSAPTIRCQVGGSLLLSGWDKHLLGYHFLNTAGSFGKWKSTSRKLFISGFYRVCC